MAQRLFLVFSVIWIGSQLTIGYLVAPALFSSLDVSMAGAAAATLFRYEAWLGLVCALALLTLASRLVRGGYGTYRRLRWIVLAMLVCVLVGYFAIDPFMRALRESAGAAGASVAQAPYAARFGMLHALATAVYVFESVLAIVLLLRLPVASTAGAGGSGLNISGSAAAARRRR